MNRLRNKEIYKTSQVLIRKKARERKKKLYDMLFQENWEKRKNYANHYCVSRTNVHEFMKNTYNVPMLRPKF